MPARDTHHDTFRQALLKDGWLITHDPLRLFWKKKSLFIDVAAERVLAAEKGLEKIAVEIKTFPNPKAVNDIHPATGQYVFYRSLLKRLDPYRTLYLAIPLPAFKALFDLNCVGEVLLRDEKIHLIVFDPKSEVIVQWLTP